MNGVPVLSQNVRTYVSFLPICKVRASALTTKNGSTFRCSRFLQQYGQFLLNRDLALHAEREVRRAVERILAGLDVGERDGDRLACVRLQSARHLSHLLRNIGIELTLDVRRYVCRVKCDVVRAAADNHEPDAVAGLDRDVRGVETITLRIADHFHPVSYTHLRAHETDSY